VSLLFRTSNIEGPYWNEFPGATAADVIPHRYPMQLLPGNMINDESALRYSAVWACLRLRANLISTLPIGTYRKTPPGLPSVSCASPPVIVAPGGKHLDYMEWMYSTQFDLDRSGNSVGIITERNGYGLPACIELVPLAWVSVKVVDNRLIQWFIRGHPYDPCEIWHEKQYTVAGFHLGLSPIMYAAWCISENLSIQDFALSWFTSGGIPRGHLKNVTQATPSEAQTDTIKARVKESVHSGDVLVTGKDWEYNMVQAEQTGMEWIEARRLGPIDIARFLDVPADLVDAAVSGSSVTYANIIQRNLQFLTMSLGPAILRRENALNKLLPANQYVKIDVEGLLKMDPNSRTAMINAQIESKTLTQNEARVYYYDRPEFTQKDYDDMARFDPPRPLPGTAPAPQPPKKPEPAGTEPKSKTNGSAHHLVF
jgi:HK97 family phage portal protein